MEKILRHGSCNVCNDAETQFRRCCRRFANMETGTWIRRHGSSRGSGDIDLAELWRTPMCFLAVAAMTY